MLLYLFDFGKVFFEGASKSSTAFLQCTDKLGFTTAISGEKLYAI